ncbi:acetyltransferase [Algoriphagus sp.]|uniref:acetyltransferase n=1 Tax=Algoriphagus sp. TaxID=1872435 RepID=UPI003F6EFCE6
MIVAGAGGHAIELLDILISNANTDDLFFFDNQTDRTQVMGFTVIKDWKEAQEFLKNDPRFILGTGNPLIRKMFYDQFSQLGGEHIAVKGKGIAYSNFTTSNEADIFNLCFIGANTQIGKGTLINTGAQVHHDVQIGAFSDINPGAILLGACQIGGFCSVGANATILPKVRIGNNVIVGAGSVVTQDVPDGVTVVGVPGKIL